MESTIGSVRPFAALNQVGQSQASPSKVRPRCEVVVEVFAPDPPAPALHRVRHQPRLRPLRWGSAAVVIGLHAAVGAWLWRAPVSLRQPPPESLVLLAEIPTTVARPQLTIDVASPDLSATPALAPKLPELPRAASEIAVSISPATAVLIGEANGKDIEEIVGFCAVNKVVSARHADHAAAPIVLVKVEKDGRVSDSRIEKGSGVPRMDEEVVRCLLAHGVFGPYRVDGAPIASWQRVHWPALQSSR